MLETKLALIVVSKELADFSINLIQQEPSTYTYVNRSLITVFEEPNVGLTGSYLFFHSCALINHFECVGET